MSFLHKCVNRVKREAEKLYSLYKSREFAATGRKCRFSYPLHLHNGRLIEIGDNFRCDRRLRLEAFATDGDTPKIRIGNNVHITWDCHIGAINRVEIHDNVLIGSRVLITDHSHGAISAQALATAPEKRPLRSKGPVVIEENVWIGEGAAILPGVTVGRNAIIGANSVVTCDIPADSVAVGSPARVIRTL